MVSLLAYYDCNHVAIMILQRKGDSNMTLKSIIRGVTVGATVGTVCYMMSKATSRQKHDIKKNAGKAVKAAGCVLDDITSLMW